MTVPAAETIIRMLGLAPHPEGGHYRETFRDPSCGADGRAASSLIYFLLQAGEISAWHKVDAAEAWHYYGGSPLRLSFHSDGEGSQTVLLGSDLLAGQRPQCVVPARAWQMAECVAGHEPGWTLVGCSVAPAFQFSGFEMAPPGWRPRQSPEEPST